MIEVLKQMVEALKSATVDCSNFHHAKKDQNHNLGECPPVIRWHHAIEAGKQAIAEAEKQEPFGFFQYDMRLDAWVQNRNSNKGAAFYTHPQPKREPLTDEQIEVIAKENEVWRLFRSLAIFDFVKAIEAAHGIKE